MKEFWMKVKESFFNIWNRLDIKQKVLFSGGALLILALAIFLIVLAGRPKLVPLYTDLGPEDAAAVVEKLREKKVPYELGNEGTAVLVPASEKYELRLDLAGEGIPKGGRVGFETFNQTRFGETESERRIRYLAALTGELETTIMKLDATEDVRVHIVIPEPSLFLDQEKDATAAIVLKLKPGRELQEQQVNGIMHLVAGSVDGLKPENVTVLDTQGNILSEGFDNQGTSQTSVLTTKQIQFEQDFERRIEKSVQSMLEKVAGPGKVVVRANAVLDFDQVEITKEDYGDKQVRSQQVTEESSTSNTTNPGGNPGVDSNIPQYPEVTGGDSGGSSQRTEKVTNYEIDKAGERRIVAPGQVKQLSLSVIMDGEPDALKQREIEMLVASAAGVNPERGDNLTVTYMPFDTAWEGKLEQEMAAARRNELLVKYGTIAALILGFSLLAAVLSRRFRRRKGEEIDYFAGSHMAADEVLATREPELTPEEKEKVRILEQIQDLTQERPQDAAQLIKTWLSEESR